MIFNKYRKTLTALVFITLVAAVQRTSAQDGKELHGYNISTVSELKEFFRYTPDRIPLVCGHRGGAVKGYSENTIATFEHTLSQIPAFFEVDPRLTKDSAVVVLHDAALDRTTTGTGKLSDYTLDEVCKLKLKDPEGNVTPYRIHTLDEVIKWSKGKTILMIDKKDVPLPMLLKIIEDNQAESHVLVSSYKAEEARFYHERNKDIMFEAFIKSKEQMQEYEDAGIPWGNITAYLSQPKNKELYDALHEKGVMCIIYTAPVFEKVKDPNLRKAIYREIIKSGTDILLSDKVVEAANAIKALAPAKSAKERFFKK